MESSLTGPHAASAAELKERMAAERRGRPFLILRDGSGTQHLIELGDRGSCTVGRSPDCDVPLPWDGQVSRVHAELVRIGSDWAVDDGGLSRNGTYVNGERIAERRRLHDGDTLRLGGTAMVFRRPAARPFDAATTILADNTPGPGDLSSSQRAVLRELCRPFAVGTSWARPATNPEIAEALYLSLDAVKGHLRVLFAKFGVEQLPQNEKRLRLAERALASGAVVLAELRDGERS
ncbi:MAG TPA: FHA domain-containing protein [Baekduia sp.]|nr:FHA domain-containing protein [Baekduia sp.]